MLPRANRLFVLLLAVLALEIAFILPGPLAFAAGLVGFHLLPLLLRPRIGAMTQTVEGLVVVTNRTDGDRTLAATRVWGILVAIAYAVVGHGETTITSGMASIGTMSLLLVAIATPMLLYRLVARRLLAETIQLEPTMLTVHGPAGPQVIPYAAIERIEQGGPRLSIVTDDERTPIVVGGNERNASRIKLEIETAIERAAGATDPHAELRRPTGMPMREWLQRLDMIAATARAGAYRGNGLDPSSLWRVLADAQADRDVRTAAARILAAEAPPETRLRITESGKLEDIELAIGTDLDAVVAGLEAQEQETLRRLAGM